MRRMDRVSHEVRFAADWAEMSQLAQSTAPQLVVFDPYASGRLDLQSCSVFRSQFASVALFAYIDLAGRSAHDMLCLARMGVCGAATRDYDDGPAMLRHHINMMLGCSIAGEVLAALQSRLTPQLTTLIRHLLEDAQKPVTPQTAGKLCHCHPKTLRVHLRNLGLPPLHHLLTWMRLMRAAHLLQDTARPIEDVALQSHFPSGNALRNQLHRYAEICPKQLRSQGGFRFLLQEFCRRYAGGQDGSTENGEEKVVKSFATV